MRRAKLCFLFGTNFIYRCSGLNHIEMFQAFVQISQIEQTSNFILRRSNVMRFMMRWALNHRGVFTQAVQEEVRY